MNVFKRFLTQKGFALLDILYCGSMQKKSLSWCLSLLLLPFVSNGQKTASKLPLKKAQTDSIPTWTRKIDTLLVKFLGEPLLTVLSESDSVYAYLIEPHDTTKNHPQLHGYDIVQQAGKLTTRQQEHLVNLVTTTDNYSLNGIKKNCVFQPGIAFQFFHRNQRAEILICLNCDEWAFYYPAQPRKKEDCDTVRLALIRLAKRLFPRDVIIQNLK